MIPPGLALRAARRVGALLLFLGLAAPAHAGIGLTVTPGKIELSMKPGTTVNVPVIVSNPDTSPAHITISIDDFTIDDAGTYTYTRPAPGSLATWVALRPREFDIAANSFQQVQLTLLVPQREMSGEYAGVLLFQTRAPRVRGGMAFSARYADKVYALVDGTAKRAGVIEHINATLDPQGTEHYSIVFHNTGNMHEYLNGRVEIVHDGAVLQTLPFRKNVLVERGTDRTLEVTGPKLAPAAYDVVAIIDYGGNQRTGGKVHLEAHS
jgi:hypothetical protein